MLYYEILNFKKMYCKCIYSFLHENVKEQKLINEALQAKNLDLENRMKQLEKITGVRQFFIQQLCSTAYQSVGCAAKYKINLYNNNISIRFGKKFNKGIPYKSVPKKSE
jgi:hypothetical protein